MKISNRYTPAVWRKIGNALIGLGASIAGLGIIKGVPDSWVLWLALSGGAVASIGKFVTSLYAANSRKQ